MTVAAWGACLTLFGCGAALLVLRRELLAMLLGLELMVSAAIVPLVCHAAWNGDAEALAAALLVIAVAAAEAVAGLSLILLVSLSGQAPEPAALRELKG